MSKAFTREDDGGAETLPPYAPPWPPGARNYITAAGHERLRGAHAALTAELAALGERAPPETVRRLEILRVHLDAAAIVPSPAGCEEVRFGTEVTLKDEAGAPRRYGIVGVDEVDAGRGRVSWLSPIARALQGRRVDDVVTVRSPRGAEDLQIVSIAPLEP